MPKHILVPVDESKRSREAFEYATREYGHERLTAFHVVDPSNFYAATGLEGGVIPAGGDLQEQMESRADRVLDRMESIAADQDIDIETDFGVGTVANTIVRYAEEAGVDHIVMGSHGRSGASRILLGSVAERVTRRAPVSVTIVR